MFNNPNTPLNQQQSFSTPTINKTSPFTLGFQKTNQPMTSLFQSPNQSSITAQPTTPTFFQSSNLPVTTSPHFSGMTGFNNSFSSPATGMFSNQTQSSTFGNKPLTSGFNSVSTIPPSFSQNTQTSQGTNFLSNFKKPEELSSNAAIPLGYGTSNVIGNQQSQISGVGTSILGSQQQQTFGSSSWSNQPTQGFVSSFGTSQPSSVGAFGALSTPASTGSIFSSTQTGSFGPPAVTTQANMYGSTFGSQPVQSTSFGSSLFASNQPVQSSTFGSSIFSSKPFGTSTTVTSTGAPSSGFGSSYNQPVIGGGLSFGSTSQPSTTSQNTFSNFGQTAFSSQPQNTLTHSVTPLGQTQSAGMFSQPISSTSFGSTFGQTQISQPTGFGSTQTQPSTNVFSQPSMVAPFPQSSSSNMFAATSQTGSQFPQSFGSSQFNQTSFPPSSQFSVNTGINKEPTPTQSYFPSTSITGGGFSTGTSSTFPQTPFSSGPTINLTTMGATTQSFPGSMYNPPVAQSGVLTGIPNMASVINSETDKSIEVFGYKAPGTRFGPLEYFNTNYESLPDLQNVTDVSLNMCSGVTSKDIESLSYNPYEYDLKLGSALNANNDFELRDVPIDTITKLCYSRYQPNLLACASWDGTVSIWKIDDHFNQVGSCKVNVPGCIFDFDWLSGGTTAIMAGSSGALYHMDIQSQSYTEFGKHNGPVKAVKANQEHSANMIISGSWDGTVKIWDLRTKVCASTIQAGGKVFGLDVCSNGFSFINSERVLMVYRYNETSRAILKRNVDASPYPLRSIAMTTYNCRKEGGFVVVIGTCGGKVSVAAQSNNAKDLSFKVNRVMQPNHPNQQNAFPIHDLAFHPRSYVLAVGGGDGSISLWNIQKHTRVHLLNRSSLPVTALSFNSDGRILAYAVGYDWSRGIRGYKFKTMKPSIFLRKCDQELKYASPNPVHYYS